MLISARATWDGGTRPPVRTVHRIPGGTHTHVEVHHLGDGRPARTTRASAIAALRSAYALHTGPKGWSDIFYNVAVVPSTGELISARGVGTYSNGVNSALTLLMLGDFHTGSDPADFPKMLEAIAATAAEVGGVGRLDWHARRAAFTGKHASACPGARLVPELERIRTGVTVAPASITGGHPLMALTDDQQVELLLANRKLLKLVEALCVGYNRHAETNAILGVDADTYTVDVTRRMALMWRALGIAGGVAPGGDAYPARPIDELAEIDALVGEGFAELWQRLEQLEAKVAGGELTPVELNADGFRLADDDVERIGRYVVGEIGRELLNVPNTGGNTG